MSTGLPSTRDTMHLQHFDPEVFLRDYWQRKPLLIRNPWSAWINPLEPDELAGLACESDVESRIIVSSGATLSVEHGPIPEERFGELGQSPWTLLVQAVDHHVPEVAALLEPFRFIPNWRIDDVMVSYAADQGGVGPHFDQYDVFLVQGLGRRLWQVGTMCDEATRLLPHDDLRLLEHFDLTDEWVLEPGDILYVPPRLSHNGIALGDDCMTYSIGFRAPSRRELISAWCDDMLSGIPDDDRYTDPCLTMQDNPGEITPPALKRLHALVTEKMLDRDAFAAWFGRFNSTRRYPDIDWSPEEPITQADLQETLTNGAVLRRNPASRFSFTIRPADDRAEETTLLFVDGVSFDCHGDVATLAQRLCAHEHMVWDGEPTNPALALIKALHDQGSIALDIED